MYNASTSQDVCALKLIFGEHRVQKNMITNDAPQHGSSAFIQFTKYWGFEYVTHHQNMSNLRVFFRKTHTNYKARDSKTYIDMAL